MDRFFLSILAIFLLLIGLQYLILLRQLLKTRLRYPHHQIGAEEAAPGYIQAVFQKPITELASFGFGFCHYLEVEPIIKLDLPKDWAVLLYNETQKTYAIAGVHRPAESTHLFDISFYSFLADGTLLMTMNGKDYGILAPFPNTIVQDPYAARVEGQWQMHWSQLNLLLANQAISDFAPVDFLHQLDAYSRTYVDSLISSKVITRVANQESFQLTLSSAIKLLGQFSQGAKKEAAIAQHRKQLIATDPQIETEVPPEIEVQQFGWMQQMQRGLLGRKLGLLLLFVSLGLFIASFMSMLDFRSLWIFLAALVFHEAGHLVAMKLCGYRDNSILFLPFLGAVATGSKEDATLTEKVWVLLAGPLPGLILGIGLAIASSTVLPHATGWQGNTWVRDTSLILIVLNLFNLLPVYPLDGGQIVNLLLFSRFAYAEVLFKLFAVVMLGLIALSSPGLFVLVALVAFGIPTGFRIAKLDARLRRELRQNPAGDREGLLQKIFSTIHQMGYGKLPFAQRFAMAKDLVSRHREAHAHWSTRIILSAIYSLSLVGGFVGSVRAVLGESWFNLVDMAFTNPSDWQQRELERANQALQQNPNDANAYVKRAKARLVLRDLEGALADYNQAIRLNPNDAHTYLLRAGLHRTQQNHQAAIADYNQAIRLNPEDHQVYFLRAAAHSDASNHPAAIKDYDQLLRLQPKNPSTYFLRARERQKLKDFKGAIADYDQALQLYPQNPTAYLQRGQVRYLLRDYTGTLVDVNQAIQLMPEYPEAYTLRANTHYRLGNKPQAIADKQKADALYKQIEAAEETLQNTEK